MTWETGQLVNSMEKKRCPGRFRGFSLIEMMVVLGLLAIMLAIAVPTVASLARVELRGSAGRFRGIIRDSYARAALTGKTHRLVMDLDRGKYWVESTESNVFLPHSPIDLEKEGDGSLRISEDPREKKKRLLENMKDEEARNLLKDPEFTPIDDALGQKQKLSAPIHFQGVWANHLKTWARKGEVQVYFFPGGYMEEAFVSLSDDKEGKRVITVIARPLTGDSYLENGEPAIQGEDAHAKQ